ncbi:MAG TPA: hypothetical protein PKC13_24225 [Blastocatellia bacterium]|nr:hypothetical protein [Blastocatellia bacterium]
MPVTANQFVGTVGGLLRRGQSESASGIFNDWIVTLLPTALDTFANKVAADAMKRGILTRKFEVPLSADGIGDFSANDSGAILKAALCYAQCEDLGKQNGAGENFRLIYKPNWQDVAELDRYLDPQFAYFAVRNNTVVTRAAEGEPAVVGPLWIYAVYVPDFDAYPMPDELVGEAMQEVLALAGTVLTAK